MEKRQVLLGVYLALGLYFISLFFSPLKQFMGVTLSWKQISNFFFTNGWFLLLQQLKVLVYYLIINLSLISLLLFLRKYIKIKLPEIVPVIVFYLLLLLASIGRNPQLYQESVGAMGDGFYLHLVKFTILLNPNIVYVFLLTIFLISFSGLFWRSLQYLFEKFRILKRIRLLIIIGLAFVFLIGINLYFGVTAINKYERIHVWLGVDSLRYAEVLDEKTMPFLNKLLRENYSSKRHQVPLARTFPAFATMYSGQYAALNRVRHMFPADEHLKEFSQQPNLVAYLHERGFETKVVADFAGDIFNRLPLPWSEIKAPKLSIHEVIRFQTLKNQFFLLPFLANFFGRNLEPSLMELAEFADADQITQMANSALDAREKGRSLFLQIFYGTAHFPYSPPYPYYTEGLEDYVGKYAFKKFIDPSDGQLPSPADQQRIRRLFQASLKSIDAAIANFFDHLKSKNLLEKTSLIIFGDHGENLYEISGGYPVYQGHGEHLYGASSMYSPVVFVDGDKLSKLNRLKKSSVSQLVTSQLDLFITTVDWLFGEAAKKNLEPLQQGKSLFDLYQEEAQPRDLLFETGLWFSDKGDFHFQKNRIMYPDISQLATLNQQGAFYILPEYSSQLETAKFRALDFFDSVSKKEFRILFMPNVHKSQWQLFEVKSAETGLELIEKSCQEQTNLCNQGKQRLIQQMRKNGFNYFEERFFLKEELSP